MVVPKEIVTVARLPIHFLCGDLLFYLFGGVYTSPGIPYLQRRTSQEPTMSVKSVLAVSGLERCKKVQGDS